MTARRARPQQTATCSRVFTPPPTPPHPGEGDPRTPLRCRAVQGSHEAGLDEPVADIGGEQRRAGRPAVPALVGLLAHLRPDAHPQPDARLVLHAGRLLRRHAALAWGELL